MAARLCRTVGLHIYRGVDMSCYEIHWTTSGDRKAAPQMCAAMKLCTVVRDEPAYTLVMSDASWEAMRAGFALFGLVAKRAGDGPLG